MFDRIALPACREGCCAHSFRGNVLHSQYDSGHLCETEESVKLLVGCGSLWLESDRMKDASRC